MTPGVEPPMTKPSAVSRMPISSGILFVSTISSGRVRPDRSCTKRSVPPASTLAIPEAPAKISTASSTLVGAAKLRLGMFAPEFARAHSGGPKCRRRAALAYTTIPCGVKNYVGMPPGAPRNPDNDDSHTRPATWVNCAAFRSRLKESCPQDPPGRLQQLRGPRDGRLDGDLARHRRALGVRHHRAFHNRLLFRSLGGCGGDDGRAPGLGRSVAIGRPPLRRPLCARAARRRQLSCLERSDRARRSLSSPRSPVP